MCCAPSLVVHYGLFVVSTPWLQAVLVRFSHGKDPKLEGEKSKSSCAPFVAAFAASERRAQRNLRGPGNFPEAPYWASAVGLLLLHQVWKLTWLWPPT